MIVISLDFNPCREILSIFNSYLQCNFVHEMGEHRPAKHSVPSLYKTRLCRTFMERGSCPYGDKCDFAHGTNDLSYDITKHPKYRTKLCRTFQEMITKNTRITEI